MPHGQVHTGRSQLVAQPTSLILRFRILFIYLSIVVESVFVQRLRCVARLELTEQGHDVDTQISEQDMGASSSADHGAVEQHRRREEEEASAASTGFLPILRAAFPNLTPPGSSSLPLASLQVLLLPPV